jgi:dTDP-glucose pyrophosphorylase
MNIIIPMAGEGARFKNAGFSSIKPLIKIRQRTFIEWSTKTLGITGNYIYIILKKHEDLLTDHLKEINPNCTIIVIDELTSGCAETCLFAKEYINNDNPLIITNCDQILEWDSSKYMEYIKENDPDGNVVTFYASTNKNSYVVLDENGYASRFAEKEVISEHSLIGVHYWKHGKYFVDSAEKLIKYNIRANNEFYISLTYNMLIKDGKKITKYSLPENEKYYSIGTPDQLYDYLHYVGDDMLIYKMKDMVRGWFIGNFSPSAFNTKDFEVGYLTHKKNEQWSFHYHQYSTEINFLISGKMQLNNKIIEEGDIFVFKPNQIATPQFLEDCRVLCIKVPSIPGDKVLI